MNFKIFSQKKEKMAFLTRIIPILAEKFISKEEHRTEEHNFIK
jgi:hypothetical protein